MKKLLKPTAKLVFFLVAFLVGMAGLSIYQTANLLEKTVKQKAKTSVILTTPAIKSLQQKNDTKLDFSGISGKVITQLAQLKQVKSYNKYSSTTAQGLNFTIASAPDDELDFMLDNPDITLTGVLHTSQINQFVTRNYKIIEGRGLKPSDNLKQNAVIERNLAHKNNLHVGDSLKISKQQKTYKLKIIGIYQAQEGFYGFGVSLNGVKQEPANTIYVSYNLANQLKGNNQSADLATFELKDFSSRLSFIKQAKKVIADTNYLLQTNDALYQAVIQKFSNIKILAVIIVVFSLILLVVGLVSFATRGVFLATPKASFRCFWKKNGLLLFLAAIMAGIGDFLVGTLICKTLLNLSSKIYHFLDNQRLLFLDKQNFPLEINHLMVINDISQLKDLTLLVFLSLFLACIVILFSRLVLKHKSLHRDN